MEEFLEGKKPCINWWKITQKGFLGQLKKKPNRLTFISHLTYKKEYHGEDHGFICVKYLKYLAVRVKQ